MKRKIQALILSIVLMLTGCTYLYHINTIYPWSRAEIWHCEEIEMTIHFSLDESGKLTGETYSRFKLDGSLYDVRIGFQQSAIGLMCDLDGDGVFERILDATWAYKGENMVIEINEGDIFYGQYSELVFVPSNKRTGDGLREP